MAIFKGRDAVILVGAASPAATPVGKHMDASLDMTLETADATTNDSGGSKEHEVVFDDGQLTFKCYTDEADTGQDVLATAFTSKSKIFVIYRPAGTGTGKDSIAFQASVTLKRGTPMGGLATTDVTLKKSGAFTITQQT